MSAFRKIIVVACVLIQISLSTVRKSFLKWKKPLPSLGIPPTGTLSYLPPLPNVPSPIIKTPPEKSTINAQAPSDQSSVRFTSKTPQGMQALPMVSKKPKSYLAYYKSHPPIDRTEESSGSSRLPSSSRIIPKALPWPPVKPEAAVRRPLLQLPPVRKVHGRRLAESTTTVPKEDAKFLEPVRSSLTKELVEAEKASSSPKQKRKKEGRRPLFSRKEREEPKQKWSLGRRRTGNETSPSKLTSPGESGPLSSECKCVPPAQISGIETLSESEE